MNIYQEITPLKAIDIFVVLDSSNNGFDYPIHNHPEYELNFITGMSGVRIVGDSTERYENFDLVLLGPNLFHKWEGDFKIKEMNNEGMKELKNEGMNSDKNSFVPSLLHSFIPNYRVITIQFGMGLFNGQFFQKERFYKIRKLLQESTKGIKFLEKTVNLAKPLILNLTQDKGFKNVIEFLQLLDLLSESEDACFLSSEGFSVKSSNTDNTRIQTVYNYILKNFTKSDLKIAEVAEQINMTDSAFSHFFHKFAFRSFTQFLVDVRIGYACKLMLETDDTIGQISYNSGFNNIANFNRLFKKYRLCTPVEYRRRYTEKNNFDWTNQITPWQFMPSKNKTHNPIEPQFTTQLVHV